MVCSVTFSSWPLWNLSQTDSDRSQERRWSWIGMGWRATLTFGVVPAIHHLLAHVDVASRAKRQPEQRRRSRPTVSPVSSVSLLYPRSPAEITFRPTTPGRGIFSPLFTAALERLHFWLPAGVFLRTPTCLEGRTETRSERHLAWGVDTFVEWRQCLASLVYDPIVTPLLPVFA